MGGLTGERRPPIPASSLAEEGHRQPRREPRLPLVCVLGEARLRHSSHRRPHQGRLCGRWLPSCAGANCWSRMREGIRMPLERSASGGTIFFSPYCIQDVADADLPNRWSQSHPFRSLPFSPRSPPLVSISPAVPRTDQICRMERDGVVTGDSVAICVHLPAGGTPEHSTGWFELKKPRFFGPRKSCP